MMENKYKEIDKELTEIIGKKVNVWDGDGYVLVWFDKKIRNLKKPKNTKLITAQWILNKLENHYKNLRPFFAKHLKIAGRIYYTSFGFSYDMFFQNRKQFDIDIDNIEKILKEYNIKYTCEYSDARWVYRFRISKSFENLNIIKNI